MARGKKQLFEARKWSNTTRLTRQTEQNMIQYVMEDSEDVLTSLVYEHVEEWRVEVRVKS
jgi:hypothetical protein